ncbi:Thioredoxin family protein [Sulfidibacter corallicola]|uniref:Thioredoxin family protein n=1 Tax=Sulfidibacter corallicola TaxID=2818388 RepID=A0A8A4TEK5_SULCO|nr:thioredoxin family protein [Sulfidibacter corallicola]QTD47654.1 thioredoxin family protein [Sulfidibacter corallicola]
MRLLIPALMSIALLVQCTAPSATERPAAIQFEVLSHGKDLDLNPHVAQGRFTVFDFYADWCPPCKELDRSLKDLKATYGDRLQIYKLDIVDWESELAQKRGIKDLPYLMVYGPDGKELAAGPSNRTLPALIQNLNR